MERLPYLQKLCHEFFAGDGRKIGRGNIEHGEATDLAVAAGVISINSSLPSFLESF